MKAFLKQNKYLCTFDSFQHHDRAKKIKKKIHEINNAYQVAKFLCTFQILVGERPSINQLFQQNALVMNKIA